MKNQERKTQLDITGMTKSEIQNLMELENYKPSMYYKIKKRGWMYVTATKEISRTDIITEMLEVLGDECVKHFPLKYANVMNGEKTIMTKNGNLKTLLVDTREKSYRLKSGIIISVVGQKGDMKYEIFANNFIHTADTLKEALDYIQKLMVNPHNKKQKKAKKSSAKKTVGRKKNKVGDTKVGKDGIKRVWTKLKSGKFDWRRVKDNRKKK